MKELKHLNELKATICDGSCGNHAGPVRPIRILSPDRTWDGLLFNYCDTAINEDVSRGFDIQEI